MPVASAAADVCSCSCCAWRIFGAVPQQRLSASASNLPAGQCLHRSYIPYPNSSLAVLQSRWLASLHQLTGVSVRDGRTRYARFFSAIFNNVFRSSSDNRNSLRLISPLHYFSVHHHPPKMPESRREQVKIWSTAVR
jgi:hypothetical protein